MSETVTIRKGLLAGLLSNTRIFLEAGNNVAGDEGHIQAQIAEAQSTLDAPDFKYVPIRRELAFGLMELLKDALGEKIEVPPNEVAVDRALLWQVHGLLSLMAQRDEITDSKEHELDEVLELVEGVLK